ncbi:MAG: DNA polymerase III subunit beta [Nitrospinota bacterium]
MEITVKRETLLRALQMMQGVVESRSSAMPILQNVLIETDGKKKFRMLGTNLDISVKGTFEAEVAKAGRVTLSARRIFDIVRELPEADVRMAEEQGQWVRVTCERSNFRLPGLPPADFPSLPESKGAESHRLPAKTLAEMIKKTMFAISQDETRYTYNGVFMESEDGKLRMVATDGHRLALIERGSDVKLGRGVIVHKKALGELVKLLQGAGEEVALALTQNHILFQVDNAELSARLIDGEFPKYRQVIPQHDGSPIHADREALVRALRRVSLLSNETRMVKFVFEAGQLTLTTNGSEAGEAEEVLESDYAGEKLTIGFNSRYCLDVLSILEEPRVRFELKDSLSPGIITPEGGEGYTYVVMPMRV